MSRRLPPLRHLVLVTVALHVVPGSRAAARQDARFAVVIEAPERAEAALNALGDKGYWCGGAARPEPEVALPDLVAVLVRPTTTPSTVQYRVVSGFAQPGRTTFDEALTKAGATGYRACGFTSARALGRRTGGPQVALMIRNPSDSLEPREYRAIYTSGAGVEWRRVEQALRDGFTIARAVWAPPPGAGTLPEVVFLAERDTEAIPVPAESELESDATPQGLERRMTTRARDGYRFEVAWAGTSSVSVLMTRRAAAPAGAAPTYTVTASSTGSFSPALSTGKLLASIPFRGVRFALRDTSDPGVYATALREHAAFDNLFTGPTAEAKALQDELNRLFGNRDVWPVDLVYRSTGKGRVRLEAIVDRSPGLR